MSNKNSGILTLENLQLDVNLGVGEDERKQKQKVNFSFKIFFTELPKGCYSDDIDDTFCYFEISNITKDFCKNKEFKLLEYLCVCLHAKIKGKIGNEVGLWLKVEKCSPPVEGLIGTTAFEYQDF